MEQPVKVREKKETKNDLHFKVEEIKADLKKSDAPAVEAPKKERETIDSRSLPAKPNGNTIRKFRKFWKLGDNDFNTQYYDIDAEGHLTIKEGNYVYDVVDLIAKYGSPIEIVMPFVAEERLADLTEFFRLYSKVYRYRGKFSYHYPMKVNQNKELVLPILSQGANLETASYNELWLVKRMWEQGQFNPQIRVLCNGPKTEAYLGLIEELKKNSLSIIPIVEDVAELEYLSHFKGEIGVRVDLNVKVSSRWDKKINRFGLLESELPKVAGLKNLKLIHYHIGSQIEFFEDIIKPYKKAVELYAKLKKTNPNLDTIDFGGGMPIPYDRKRKYTLESLVRKIIRYTKSYCDAKHLPHPNLIGEWGRFVVAPAQLTVFGVIAEKNIPRGNAKKWYVIDGSFMNDLLDTWSIHQVWHVVPANRLTEKKLARTWLAGSSCDSDDKYVAHGHYLLLPKMEVLDEGEHLHVAFLDTGAYQDALASHHCLLSSPVKILAHNGEIRVIRKRETAEEIGKEFGW